MHSQAMDPTEIESLLAALDNKDGLRRQEARAALLAIGRSVTPHLLPLLTHRHTHVRWEAAKTLATLADPAAVPGLIQCLVDEDPDVRWLAAEGLAAIGRPALAPLLETLIIKGDHPDVRDGVHHVLHDLEDPELRRLVAPVYDELSGIEASVDSIVAAEHVLKLLA